MTTDPDGPADPTTEESPRTGPAAAIGAAAGVPLAAASHLIDLTGSALRSVVRPDGDETGSLGPGSDEPGSDGPGSLGPGSDGQVGGDDVAETDTRQRIIDAAAAVFREKGFTGTRVVDIARRAGYTSGALYGYFDSRAELLAEAIGAASSVMLEGLLGTLGTSTRVDPVEVLDAALARLGDPLDESDQMLLDGVALAHREPVAALRLTEALGHFRAELQGTTGDGDGDGDGDGGGGSDGSRIAEGAADLLVILVLGITAARALGLHDPVSEPVRDHLTGCITPSALR